MTKRKRLVVAAIVVVALAVLIPLANWLLSPLTLPSDNTERHLIAAFLDGHASEAPPQRAAQPVFLGRLTDDGMNDFVTEDMGFWTDRGYDVRPASRLEPKSKIGGMIDKVTKEDGWLLLLKNYKWTGRNTAEANIVVVSGFCAIGRTITISHRLWGWSVVGARPFHDF